MMTRVLGLGAVVLLAVSSLPVLAQETKMTGQEITEAVFGNTLSGTSAGSGATFNVYIEKSGKARMAANTARGLFRDEGAYAVEGDQLCAAWNRVRNGQKLCQTFYRTSDGFKSYNRDGTLNSTFVIKPGNPENL
jgi:hypothetical protein